MFRFSLSNTLRQIIAIYILFIFSVEGQSQTPSNVTIPTGSFIINMGVVPQTVANGLKPYGLVYALLQANCPVYWVINTEKTKDGADFTYNGVQYKGGTFIITAPNRSAAVNTLISTWQGLGVQGTTTTSAVTVPVYATFNSTPKWTMDAQNGSIATGFFSNAGIPSSAYGGSSSNWKTPAQLNCCDDIFVMPHADPQWSTHGHLWDWVKVSGDGITTGCKSGVWLGCHAGSALMDMFNPATPSQQTNFLVDKTATASGTGPYYENALLLWGNHDDGTLPYSYDYHGDPIMQFMGTIDAAQQNGSEQIYIPKSAGWFPNTHVGVYDPDHPDRYPGVVPYSGYTDPIHRAATLAYGPAFGTIGNGKIMLESAHNIAGTDPSKVAAQRAFFNYSFLVAWEKAVNPILSAIPDTIYYGTTYPLSYTTVPNLPPAPVQTYTILWTASCGGSWSPNNTSDATTFIPPTVGEPTACNISAEITDQCGRKTFTTKNVVVTPCKLTITPTPTPPSCFGGTNGSVSMAITGGSAPYNWSWTRTNPTGGPINGTGTNISGLSAGTYTISVTDPAGCSGTATVLVTQPAVLAVTGTVTNVLCFGQSTGGINITAVGGTPAYAYNWGSGITTEDRTGIATGSYTVTVTDSKGCIQTASFTVDQPAEVLSVTGNITNVSCNGGTNGAIDITASGGTSPYTYNWGNGITTEDRTSLAPGTYTVIVTDANGCTQIQIFNVIQPSALALSVIMTNSTCNSEPPSFNGSVDLSVSGGTLPYTYDWDNDGLETPDNDTQDLSGLGPGTYTVIVTDANGCTATISATIVALGTGPTTPEGINH